MRMALFQVEQFQSYIAGVFEPTLFFIEFIGVTLVNKII